MHNREPAVIPQEVTASTQIQGGGARDPAAMRRINCRITALDSMGWKIRVCFFNHQLQYLYLLAFKILPEAGSILLHWQRDLKPPVGEWRNSGGVDCLPK